VTQIPYAVIRLVAGTVAGAWSLYQFFSQGSAIGAALGIVTFLGGWFVARRFGRPVGNTDMRPWLDTVLPIALASFAVMPGILFPFLGEFSIAVGAAVVVLFFAGMSLSLGSGPYANEKVGLRLKWL
jgi:hypothetical protein